MATSQDPLIRMTKTILQGTVQGARKEEEMGTSKNGQE